MINYLRIIHVVNVRWFNATAWYGLTLSRLLQDAGHAVCVLTLPDTESYAKAAHMGLSPVSIQSNSLHPSIFSRTVHQMRAVLRDFRPDIVNCHRGESLLLWGLLRKGHGYALIRTRGDQRPPKNNIPNKILHTRMVDAVIATNSRTARQCRGLLGVPDARLFTIAGGVDTARFRPDIEARGNVRQALGFTESDRVIGLLGRLDAVKGHQELMSAVASLCQGSAYASQQVKLLFIGFPSDHGSEQRILEQARHLGLEANIVVTGKVDDVTAYINAMDIGVIASQGSEAIARAAFEIMACGVPLLGTDVGVMPDLLSGNALVPVGDVHGLRDLVQRGLEDEAFLSHIRSEQAGKLPLFSQSAFLERTLAVYRDALERRQTIIA